jgi:guanylate kinase
MSDSPQKIGVAFVVSAPSGAGKSTIIKQVMATDDNLHFSVSCTTRRPRPGEVDGQDYYFLSQEAFQQRVDAGDFLEHAEFSGNRYGTLATVLADMLHTGQDVILEIEVQGASQIREAIEAGRLKDKTIFIFIAPPSMEELERRLRDRGTETEESIQKRLAAAAREYEERDKYHHIVVNDDLDQAVVDFRNVLNRERG